MAKYASYGKNHPLHAPITAEGTQTKILTFMQLLKTLFDVPDYLSTFETNQSVKKWPIKNDFFY
ncbi:hypothetical protein U1E44_00570 [Arenibacter sp. GZD96]|uniref:hypothetical protein n=1 Tax=Aurantibrevibacter litoralis TaxID=3106030 RepID=UPI002AFEBA72|nr:hypothetical protein [Arenibacter sp. GZD-96]MEA1784572.1 hypothetical protein [Arenibacter sp. GZD-96]